MAAASRAACLALRAVWRGWKSSRAGRLVRDGLGRVSVMLPSPFQSVFAFQLVILRRLRAARRNATRTLVAARPRMRRRSPCSMGVLLVSLAARRRP